MTGNQWSKRAVTTACALTAILSLTTAALAIEVCGSDSGRRWTRSVGAGTVSVTKKDVPDIGETLSVHGGFKFEYRVNDETVWSFTGNQTCSNSFVFCYLFVPMKDAEEQSSRVEWIMEDGEPIYIVFAHLDRLVASAQFHGGRVELKKGMGMEIEIPSSFRLEACDK